MSYQSKISDKDILEVLSILKFLSKANLHNYKIQLEKHKELLNNIIDKKKEILIDNISLNLFVEKVIYDRNSFDDKSINSSAEIINYSKPSSSELLTKFKELKNSIAAQNNIKEDNLIQISFELKTFLNNYVGNDLSIYCLKEGSLIVKNASIISNDLIKNIDNSNNEELTNSNISSRTKKTLKNIAEETKKIIEVKDVIEVTIRKVNDAIFIVSILEIEGKDIDVFFSEHNTVSAANYLRPFFEKR